MNEQSTREIWKAVLGELQLQLPRPTFETWLKHTDGVSYDEHQFVVEAPTPFAVAWLERRMYDAIQKTVEKVTDRPLDVVFRVRQGHEAENGSVTSSGQTLELESGQDEIQVKPQAQPPAAFNPKYTFDSFVVGPSNQLAYSAARAVADAPGKSYNPLFIYSGVGIGRASWRARE